MTGAAIVVLVALIAISGAAARAVRARRAKSGATVCSRRNAAHWLGTDELGRDILSRLIYGARVTLGIVALVSVVTAPVGLVLGCAAGYFGGWVEAALMRVTDVFLALPRLILALAFVAALGPGIENAVLAIAIVSWPPYARVARAETLALRHAEFIDAARLAGASGGRIVLRHIMPLCLPSVIVRMSLDMAGVILIAAGLGFLGLGRAAADGGVGRDDRDRAAIHARPLVGRGDARYRDRGVEPRVQSAGRRVARLAGPETAMSDLLAVVRSERAFRRRVRCCAASSFAMGRERVGIVGESGAGKSMLVRAIMRLLPPGAAMTGRVSFDGADFSPAMRGKRIALVLQDPRFSLNPAMPVGAQIAEVLRAHRGLSAHGAKAEALRLLDAVRIREPEQVYRRYPHQLSGGMGQRAMIAMMLASDPDLLIADEPTSALDASVAGGILALLDAEVARRGMGILLVSHDLDLVANFCDRVLVMKDGEIVEALAARDLANAQTPYTRQLLAAQLRLGA